MKHIFRIILIFSFFIRAITSDATPQVRDLLIIKNDTVYLLDCPLDVYLEENLMSSNDIPWIGNPSNSSALWRGYKATWEIENDKVFLVDIVSANKHVRADLGKMFGERYRNKKVLADWINVDLFYQYGDKVFDTYVFTILDMEKRITVDKGVVQSIRAYPTLTGEGVPNVIRTCQNKKIDTSSATKTIYDIVAKNFIWSDKMETSRGLKIKLIIGRNFENTILTDTQFDLSNSQQVLASLKERKLYYEEKPLLGEDDKKQISAIKQKIELYETQYIPQTEKEVKEEYEQGRVYLDELTRILKPLKIETVLYRGEPYLVSEYDLSFRFDAKNKVVSKVK